MLPRAEYDRLDVHRMWFTCSGRPLRWSWPLGLLYDFTVAAAGRTQLPTWQEQGCLVPSAVEPATQLPWQLEVHLDGAPSEPLLGDGSLETGHAAFMARVKEADCVRWGTARRTMDLSRRDQDTLFDAIVSDDFPAYWEIAKQLLRAPGPRRPQGEALVAPKCFRRIPLHFYMAPAGAPLVQWPIGPLQSGENAIRPWATTLATALEQLLPPQARQGVTAITHGTLLPADAELAWLASTFAHADGWCVHRETAPLTAGCTLYCCCPTQSCRRCYMLMIHDIATLRYPHSRRWRRPHCGRRRTRTDPPATAPRRPRAGRRPAAGRARPRCLHRRRCRASHRCCRC